MKVVPLSEGSFTVDHTKQFLPFNLNEDSLQKRTTGSLLVEIQPFIVITDKDILLFDTGLGFSNNGSLQLYNNLLANDINPIDVTKVLMTHLHKDHAGGVSFVDSFHKRSLSFPNATYYIQQREIDYAFEKGNSYVIDELEPLKNADNVQILDADKGTLDNYITYEVTGGHCPFHQVFWIRENGETIFFGGDDAPQLQQMKSRFVAKYDYDGKKCMELRQKWWEVGNTEGWKFLFYHDVNNPVWPS